MKNVQNGFSVIQVGYFFFRFAFIVVSLGCFDSMVFDSVLLRRSVEDCTLGFLSNLGICRVVVCIFFRRLILCFRDRTIWLESVSSKIVSLDFQKTWCILALLNPVSNLYRLKKSLVRYCLYNFVSTFERILVHVCACLRFLI